MNNKITLLVIDSDERYAKNIVACAKNHSAFLDAEYALTGTDGLEMIHELNPDAVIISYPLSGLDTISVFRKIHYSESNPFLMLSTPIQSPRLDSITVKYGAQYISRKPQPPMDVCNTIEDFLIDSVKEIKPVTAVNDELDVKVTRFLHQLGVPAHLNGYDYLRSSLIYAANDIGVLNPITKRLYPMLAKEYNKTPQSVERSIRHAIKVSWERGNKKVLYELFGYNPDSIYQGYPTNAEYIAQTADRFRIRLAHNMAI